MKKHKGFTLIELLVVIALLGFLSVTGLSLFQGSQKRSRDIRRKTDLSQIAKALEMYANDYGYPASKVSGIETGKIVGCGTPITPTACEWGGVWSKTVGTATVVYMQKLPKDPTGGSYCYQSLSKGYKLYAQLEGTDDPDYNTSPLLTCVGTKYTYVLLSPNLTPTPTP